jgi:hypothetical protein
MATEDRRVPTARAKREGTRSPSEEPFCISSEGEPKYKTARREQQEGLLGQIDVAKTAPPRAFNYLLLDL